MTDAKFATDLVFAGKPRYAIFDETGFCCRSTHVKCNDIRDVQMSSESRSTDSSSRRS